MNVTNTTIDKTKQKPNSYITEITFNNNETIGIKQNDIVIFVGPNNAGKSQSLVDIYALCEEEKRPTIIIKKIHVKKCDEKTLNTFLHDNSTIKDNGNYSQYSGYNYSISSYQINDYTNKPTFGSTRNLFVSHLNTETRLSISNPPASIVQSEPKQHPIHYAAFTPEYRKTLTKHFKKAFGCDIIPNILNGRTVPLCMGDNITLDGEYLNEQERQEEYGRRLSTYKQIQQQGDGIRSFTGILLNLMIDHYCTFLIDEPESFLHPPQATIMGRVIGETLGSYQQAFISTHSQEIIRGLLEVCPDRIKIIRITRKDDINQFSILQNEMVKNIWNDPLLKHSNIMSSMFHQTVVLCESDSDCKLYSIIHSHLKEKSGEYSEALFIHCGGKHRMPQIIAALKSLSVDIRVIADIDVLNDENVISKIVESTGANWNTYKKEHTILCSSLHTPQDKLVRKTVEAKIAELLEQKNDKYLDNNEVENLRNLLKTTSKWSDIKANGAYAIPSGNATKAYNELNIKLKQIGIFVVPCGELECFIKEIGGHGPDWVNNVLEQFTDFDNPVYSPLSNFVAEWRI